MHRHRHDHGFITLGACEVENEVAGKPPVTLKLQDGETEFTPGNFTHVTKTSPTSGSESPQIAPSQMEECGGQVLKGEPRTSGS